MHANRVQNHGILSREFHRYGHIQCGVREELWPPLYISNVNICRWLKLLSVAQAHLWSFCEQWHSLADWSIAGSQWWTLDWIFTSMNSFNMFVWEHTCLSCIIHRLPRPFIKSVKQVAPRPWDACRVGQSPVQMYSTMAAWNSLFGCAHTGGSKSKPAPGMLDKGVIDRIKAPATSAGFRVMLMNSRVSSARRWIKGRTHSTSSLWRVEAASALRLQQV